MAINVDEAALDTFLQESFTESPAPTTPVEAAPVTSETPAAEATIPSREETPSADAKVEAAVAATGQTEDKWDPETRKYIESLRSESAKYRQRGQKYNEVFDGYEDEAVDEWLSLADTLKNDPRAAAERFQEIAQAILDAQLEQEEEEPTQAPEGDRPLTRAEVEAMLAERERQADLKQRTAQIELDAKTLGYQLGSEDYDELLYTASRLKNGSIQDAHAKLLAKKQAVIDGYVQSLAQKPAPTVPGDGSPASGEQKLRTFEEANSALDAWLANQG